MLGEGSQLVLGGLCSAMDEVLRLVPGSSVMRGDGYRLHICPAVPIPVFCGLFVTDPGRDSDVADQLPHLAAEIQAGGVPLSVLLQDGSAPAVEQAAARLGLTERANQVGMLLEDPPARQPPSSDVQVDEARSPSDLREALELCASAFDAPPAAFEPLYTPEIADHPAIRIYVGRVDGTPVTTAVGVVAGGGVGVFSVATPPQHRRRGYAGDVVARVVADGFAAGAGFGFLHSSDAGLGVYERAGFRRAGVQVILTRPAQA